MSRSNAQNKTKMHHLIEPWRLAEVAEYDLPLQEAPATILDLGANVGAWSLRCAAQYPSAQIRASEPVLATAVALEKNTRGKNVTVINAAVRNFHGPADMFVGRNDCTNAFHDLGAQTEGLLVVQCHAAGTIPSAELVKIDTEGCELEIVEQLDLTDTRALIVEYHRGDAAAICETVLPKGFELISQVDKQPGYGILKFARPGVVAAPGSPARAASGVPKNIFIGIPTCGGVPARFVHSLLALAQRPALPLKINMNAGDYGVAQARNALSADFLNSACTHLLFIDSDLVFTPEDVANVCSHDQPIVGGMYPIKSDGPLVWCGNSLLGAEAPVHENGLQQVRFIGTGFLCVAREVFEKMIATDRDEIEYTLDFPPHKTEWDFWRMGVRKTADTRRRYLTEDWYFCQRAAELGYPVHADTRVLLGHIGTATWPLLHQRKEMGLVEEPAARPVTH